MKNLFLFAALTAHAYAASQSWTVGNDQVKRIVAFNDTAGLFTERFTDVVTQTDFIKPDGLELARAPEFSFQCDGHSYKGASADFSFISADAAKLADGNSLTVRLKNKRIPLEVSVIYAVYNGHPAIRKHLILQNTGSANLRVMHLNIEALAPALGPSSEVTLNTQYGVVPRETFYTGRSEDAGLLVANARTGAGFAILSEVPGYMKRTEVNAWSYPGHVQVGAMYDTDLMPFERSLGPGEQFVTAGVSTVAFRNGDGFRDPHWVLPSYTSKVLLRRIGSQGPPWIYNTWVPFRRTIDEAKTLALIDAAGVIGIDIFTIDDGWQEEYGANAVDRKAFPHGLEPIRQALDSKHMQLGLWAPLAAIGTSTPEYRNHPDWAALDAEGRPKITSTAGGSKAVMCLATDFRQSAADRLNDAISRHHLAYVKLDLTTMFNTYGEAPGCWAKNHLHRNWAESLNLIYEGIAFVTRKVYEKHPDVLLDLTFELWGQKHVIDAGLLAAGDLDWLSNVHDEDAQSPGPLQARTLLYQRAPSMPADAMLIGNLQAESPSIQERFATALGSAPLLLGDLRKLSSADRQWYHGQTDWFKKLRRRVAIGESFFPLGNWHQPSTTAWDGFARLARSGDGIVVLFRNQAGADTAKVELPLMPSGRVKVHSVITGKDLGTFSKSDWQHGISISLPNPGAVEVFELTATAAAK